MIYLFLNTIYINYKKKIMKKFKIKKMYNILIFIKLLL